MVKTLPTVYTKVTLAIASTCALCPLWSPVSVLPTSSVHPWRLGPRRARAGGRVRPRAGGTLEPLLQAAAWPLRRNRAAPSAAGWAGGGSGWFWRRNRYEPHCMAGATERGGHARIVAGWHDMFEGSITGGPKQRRGRRSENFANKENQKMI